jgi:predicted transcriptional regulator
MITPAQIRGARAMLELTQVDLANASGISKASILDIETARTKPKSSTLSSIQRALEEAGIVFVEGNGGGPGVRLRQNSE